MTRHGNRRLWREEVVMTASERREPNEREGLYGVRFTSPPPDGTPLTDEQIATCCEGVQRCLERGAWQVAVACVERARKGVRLLATDEQLDKLQDGSRLSPEIAEVLSRTVGVWLRASSVEAAATAIRRRKRDEMFIGDSLASTSLIEDLQLMPMLTRSLKAHCGTTVGDVANRFETWAKCPASLPNQLLRSWCEVARTLLMAGLLQPLSKARLSAMGRNSKQRKQA